MSAFKLYCMHAFVCFFIVKNQNLCVSVPASPEGLRVISMSPRAFSLHWLASPGCDKNYMVQLHPDHGNINITTTADSSVQVHTHTHTHTPWVTALPQPYARCQVEEYLCQLGGVCGRRLENKGESERERRPLIIGLTVVEGLVCFWSLTYHRLVSPFTHPAALS